MKSTADPYPDVRPKTAQASLTVLLQAWQHGDCKAFAKVFETVYLQLKQIAGQRLREGSGDMLSPTELLHEAVLRVVDAPMD